jgi:hypothetical protein
MKYIFLFALLCILSSCDQKYSTQKLGANDPFKSTMVPSEFFSVNADIDNVIEGANGTTIALPKGCFKDKDGNVVTGDVKVELAEALTLDKMLASNLTATSDGNPLETNGMIYFNAKANGAELSINKDKPVYIEIPSKNKRDGMMVYRGVRDDHGNMNWIKPKKTETFLTAVDVSKLDFLPDGFEGEVKHSMPFGGMTVATKVIVDSLYYSFSTLNDQGSEGLDEVTVRLKETGGNAPVQMNEARDNPNKKIENGAYTKESYNQSEAKGGNLLLGAEDQKEIDPARIKALKDPRFNNTLIATHEFEKRLKQIFNTCNKDVLEIYVKNLDKNMWELDQMAADKLGSDPMAKVFKRFAKEKLTNVKDAPEQAQLMADYYENQVRTIEGELSANKNKMLRLLADKQKVADSMTDAYQKLLWKREKYRMERYKFRWTDMGWVNIDTPARGLVIGQTKSNELKLEVRVANGKSYDRVHVYTIYSDINSLYKLNTDDNEIHYVGNSKDRTTYMKRGNKAYLIAVAYKGDNAWLGVKEYTTGSTELINISVTRSSQETINSTMNDIEKGNYDPSKPKEKPEEGTIKVSKKSSFTEENSVVTDLAYQDFFYQENKRQQGLYRDQMILEALEKIIHPCQCKGEAIMEGRMLFRSNCRSCHSISVAQTGPALAGVTYRHDRKWLYSWTRNWKKMVDEGDPYAIRIQNYAPSQMNLFPNFKDEDLKKLYDYIECEGGAYTARN